ncbi:UNVERIFIED_CONTAM: hypothetical protein Sangu_2422200 [Sesamum angustifolium]|uniref:Uncharacterized protein n=1 Tax=Sesamum angustifolium TaxID=2727405 RepID=A0AAW2KZD4_9LAMI
MHSVYIGISTLIPTLYLKQQEVGNPVMLGGRSWRLGGAIFKGTKERGGASGWVGLSESSKTLGFLDHPLFD